jgi:hypothetical protein
MKNEENDMFVELMKPILFIGIGLVCAVCIAHVLIYFGI